MNNKEPDRVEVKKKKADTKINQSNCNSKVGSSTSSKSSVSDASTDSSEVPSSSIGDSSSSSQVSLKKGKKRPKTKPKKRKVDEKGRKHSLTEYLKHLDSRKVPKQEPYNEETGQDLKVHLEKFEKYCKENFKGDEDFWTGELERNLSGKALESFQTLRHFTD